MSLQEKINSFDPNGLGAENGNLYGLPFSTEEAQVVLIPVPWEVTVSYAAGTADGPQAILDASVQVDLFDSQIPDAWKLGIGMQPINAEVKAKSDAFRKLAERVIEAQVEGADESTYSEDLNTINQACDVLKMWVKAQAEQVLNQGKIAAVLGGDHSTPLGLMEALASRHEYGILQVDAHCDLRDAYEGFTYSHASIMFNALKIPQVTKLVQVGIRDFCQAEYELAQNSGGRVIIHEYRNLASATFQGKTWHDTVQKIIVDLPEKVYVSFDIDGLAPFFCPNTGTPVVGGLSFDEASYLLEQVVASGRKIIGFDLNEVAPGEDEWDANVGARLLYRLCNLTGKSQGLI